MEKLIDLTQPSLYISLASIAFNPVFWNIVARFEYKNKVLTKIAGGSPYLGCYGLAATIFSLGIIRDILFEKALRAQPSYPLLQTGAVKAAAAAFFIYGQVLVVSSMWALGVTGTYLGDYFGILMDERVTGFPFNITDNPMYWGSTLAFFGTSLWYGKPAGLAISAFVFVMYKIALLFEEPFTAAIYAKRDNAKKSKKR
ncbi:hypothetical protein CANCADRAFT_99825 [Tortispora caseinolytica NRRL Y-17796]|uniref:Phosphatidyl-N-methylethanolamine N-methyltransferase n=1 Tax=Tortispora caseinolytica NRRL Y-17796 TaxID=767744 RepID=A0A1E4TEA3_9ASCO|nr:hypothetical protein CANCADRAFT_99825 [Tortispora caseinolytica NRRL Y-17796]